MRRAALFGFVLSLLCASSLRAAGGPENAVVLVNADSWASTCLANRYIHARRIPADNVILLSDLPSFERMPVAAFRDKILLPVLRTIEERGLAAQIDYVLYSADFPTAIDVTGDIGARPVPKVLTPQAAINGLTYLYQPVLAKNPAYLDLHINHYARRVVTSAHDTPWTDQQREQYVQALLRLQQLEPRASKKQPADKPADKPADPQVVAKQLAEILERLEALRKEHPQAAELHYNRACVLARLEKFDQAMAALTEAVEAGWWDHPQALRDDDLRGLRARDDFKRLIEQLKRRPLEIQPAVRFSAASAWLPGGQRGMPNLGPRYLLSTMLAYTSGRGNSVAEAWSGLRQSIAADATRPTGTVYYLQNNDIRSTTRQWGFEPAAAKLRELGVGAKVEQGVLPANKTDVAGLCAGSASFQWSASGSRIVPGAICEHLTSCGGMLHEGAGQTPLTEFLRYGAAGASGTVTEPYAIQAKFPTPFVQLFYAQGCTLAEAFYSSVTGPYQLLIVGDALCAPWARRLEVAVDGLPGDGVARGTLRITPRVKAPSNAKIAVTELLVDGRRVQAASGNDALTLDTTALPDGPHEIGVVLQTADALATRGAMAASLTVRNGGDKLATLRAPQGDVAWHKTFEIELAMPGAKEIVVAHHGRELARKRGDRATLTVDPRQLGVGPARLQPLARRAADGREVWGAPIQLTVVPPPALPAQKAPDKKSLAPGMHLIVDRGPPQVLARLDADALAKSGVKPGQSCAIEAWFEAADDDVYQFQILGDARTLSVDGQKLDWPRGTAWWHVPVALARGWHQVRIEGPAGKSPKLDVRFGGRGTQRLDGARFQHVEAAK